MGPGAIKWLPLPPPRPGTVLGSGKTQKTGSISANNSATASVCAAQASGASEPVPAPPGRAGRLGHPWTPPNLPGALFAQL